MFENFVVGQTVIIELPKETIIGDVHFIGKSLKRIKILNAKNIINDYVYVGISNYYISEIIKISLAPSNKVSPSPKRSFNNKDLASIDYSFGSTKFKEYYCDVVMKTNDILERTVYITKADAGYYDAIKLLKSQYKVSLTIEHCEIGRNSLAATIITLFAPANKTTYIFDMLFLPKMGPEFKEIFTKSHPQKIVFDSRYICDYLFYKYSIKLNGVSDNLVGHAVFTKSNQEIKVIECLNQYFDLPRNYFEESQPFNWTERPLHPKLKILTAKKVILNFLLEQKLLYDCLLKPYFMACDKFSKLYSTDSNYCRVAMKMAHGDKKSVEEVANTDMQLAIALEDLAILKKN